MRLWPIPFLSGEPGLGPLEDSYRRHTLADDAQQLVVIGWIYIAAHLIYSLIDYGLFGLSATLAALYSGRSLMIVLSLLAMLVVRRAASYHLVDWVALLWSVAVAVFALYVHYTRLDSYISNSLNNIIIVIVFYTVTPNRYLFRIVPAALLSAGEVALGWAARADLTAVDLRSVAAAMALVNVVGIVISVHLYTYRRNQFKARHEERQARQEVERLARIDSLTQTLTRRRFMELAEGEFERFGRYRHPFSLLILDLDHFKSINDTYGHAAGDAVLKGFAVLACSLVRQSDFVGRLGGEEFAILLPGTGADAAARLAARLREACEQMTLPTRSGIVHVTTSIGVAEVQPNDESLEAMFHRADRALYHVKANGRNGVRLSG